MWYLMRGSHYKPVPGRDNIKQRFLKYSHNRVMKSRIIREVLTVVAITAFILQLTPFISSCTRKPSFGDLTICGEIDAVTFAPLDARDSFDIGVKEIFASIKVSQSRAEDIWRFIWKNKDTGEVIADSTGSYSSENSGYIEGYLSNYVVPGQEGGIIGKPGNYRVDFYHNGQLISSTDFVIESPELEITGAVLSSEIDEAGQPTAVTESFYPDDIIYTFVKLNCKIKGETISVKWYRGEDELLGQKEFTTSEDYYLPDYIVFKIANDEPWPVDSYRIEVFCNGLMDSEYHYEIVKREVPDATFSQGNVYQNEEYKFSIRYPDGWNSEEEESEKGLEINFMPDSDNINVTIHMQVLKKGYFPSEGDYSSFADNILSNVVDSSEAAEVQKTESTGEINDVTYKQINYHCLAKDKDGWDVDLIFINKNGMFYLFIRVSDLYYQIFANDVCKIMLDSLSFD